MTVGVLHGTGGRLPPRAVAQMRVLVFSLMLAVAAVVLYSSFGVGTWEAPLPADLPWWVLVALFVASERLVVEFPVRGHNWSISMDEVALTIGLVVAPPEHLLTASLLAGAIVNIALHRRPVQKTVYNLSATALRVAGALVLYHAALGSTAPLEPAGWLAAFWAIVLPSSVTFLTVCVVIGLAEGTRPRLSVWAPVITLIQSVVNTSFALIALEVVDADLRGVWLLVLVYGMLFAAYRSLVTARHQQRALAHVDAFARAVGGAASTQDVATALVHTAVDLSGAGRARLLVLHEGQVASWDRDREGHRGPVVLERPGLVGVLEAASRSSSPQIVRPLGRRHRSARSPLLPQDAHGAVVVGFCGGDDLCGALVVADRGGAYRSFSRREALLLETLVAHAVAALQNAILLERVHREVTQREHDALYDQVTGLPNRLLFLDRLERAAEVATAELMAAVLLVDLDRFHEINATFGHRTGDELLNRVGGRLRDEVPATATVARLGGDEFAILLCEVADIEHAQQAAAHLLTVLERPHQVGATPLDIEASVGIALAPTHGAGAVELLRRADVAMYAAKHSSSGIEVYVPATDRHTPARLRMVSELRAAIESGRLQAYYQPKASLRSGAVGSLEALARWEHPERGFVPPSEFIVVAEHTGLIRPFTRWMLREVAGQLREWRRAGLNLEAAVNLSARSLLDTNLPGDIAALLGEFGLPPQALRLEITESSLIADPDLAGAVLSDLSVLGVGLSLDDFGTGYSSLSHLIRLPVDEVKIDRSFVSRLVDDGQESAIVRATIDMSRRLGKQVTAEGIEDQDTWDVLRSLGCDLAQGYFIAAPMPAAVFERWLIERTELSRPQPVAS